MKQSYSVNNHHGDAELVNNHHGDAELVNNHHGDAELVNNHHGDAELVGQFLFSLADSELGKFAVRVRLSKSPDELLCS